MSDCECAKIKEKIHEPDGVATQIINKGINFEATKQLSKVCIN